MPAAARVLADLMTILGVENVNHAPPGFQTRALSDLNGARQEIYDIAPTEWFSTDDRGEQVRAPTAVTLTVTQFSKAITFGGYAGWMLGCTIVIDGDSAQNQLLSLSASPSLRLPYQGASGTVGATVYHDKVAIDTTTFSVVGPVGLDGQYEVFPVPSKRDLQYAMFNRGDYYGDGSGYRAPAAAGIAWTNQPKPICTPTLFLVERLAPFGGNVTPAVCFNSCPDKTYVLTYSAQLNPTPVASFSDTREELVPFGFEDTILYPIVRWRFASWPGCAVPKSDMEADYKSAVSMLKSLNPAGYQANMMGASW